MSLDWANERYVRVYTRDTAEQLCWPWEARAIWWLLIRKADRSGMLPVPTKLGMRGVAALISMPVEVVEVGLAALLEDGCVRAVPEGFLIPNYIEAQGDFMNTYVVRSGASGPVKIGRSKDPANRIATLQTGCAEKLTLLHLLPWDAEKDLHRRLASWRMRGEWFSAQCIAALAAAVDELSAARLGGPE